jgi:scyllo-inositol 2-dehydrogenase (NADP+)
MSNFVWGIIGPGWIASEFSNDMKLTQSANHKVGPVMGRTMDEAKAFARKYGSDEYFNDINAFLQAPMDAVYIATPHPLHHRDTIACLNYSIPVLCEKPISINSSQLTEMIAAARRNNTFLVEGMWIRFLPSITQVLTILDQENLGAIQSIASTLSYVEENDPTNRFFNPRLGGGSLLDLGSYSVYLAHLLLGKPSKVEAEAALTEQSIDKSCTFRFTYANGATATGHSTFVDDRPNTAEIVCEEGKIIIGDAWNEQVKKITVTYKDGRSQEYTPQWEGHGFQYEIDAVYGSISRGEKEQKELPLSLSMDMMNTIDEIRSQTGIVYPYDANPHTTPDS